MSTSYSLGDSLPRDAGGQKFAALVDIATSAADFALHAGIGKRTEGTPSKIFAAMQVGTHIGGSKIESPVVGIVNLLAFTNGPSAIATGGAIPWRGDQKGAAYVTGLSTVASQMSGSTETFTVASGTLYSAFVSASGALAGACVTLMNGATSLANFVFSGANETLPQWDLGGHGTCFGSLRYERRNTVGNVYVTALYSNSGEL